MTKLVAIKEPYTRLTPNANGWVKPSGPCGKCRTENRLFEGDNGFGFEEWLFNPKHAVDGWQFGYIQAFRKNHQGECFPELDLLTRICHKRYSHPGCAQPPARPADGWYFVTTIRKVRCLTNDEASSVLRYAIAQGWIAAMVAQLQPARQGTFDNHKAGGGRNIFNAMFLREEASVPEVGYQSLQPVANAPTDQRFRIHPGNAGRPCLPIPHRIFS